MIKIACVGLVALSLAGCQLSGFKTGPLSDPEVLAQRCAEANLAVTLFDVASKGKNADKIEKVRVVLSATCSGGVITDYPSALNAISTALLMLK